MTIEVSRRAIMPNGNMGIAPPGYKLAKINLNGTFSSHGEAGYIIQRSCQKVLIRLKTKQGKLSQVSVIHKVFISSNSHLSTVPNESSLK